jgi:hypothetical protein
MPLTGLNSKQDDRHHDHCGLFFDNNVLNRSQQPKTPKSYFLILKQPTENRARPTIGSDGGFARCARTI